MAIEFRTVIDTTVAISAALLPRSVPRQAFDAALARGRLLVSESRQRPGVPAPRMEITICFQFRFFSHARKAVGLAVGGMKMVNRKALASMSLFCVAACLIVIHGVYETTRLVGIVGAWSLLLALCVAFLSVEEIDKKTANGRGRILAELVFLLTVVLFVFMLFLPMWKFCQSKTAPHDGVVQAADDDSTRW